MKKFSFAIFLIFVISIFTRASAATFWDSYAATQELLLPSSVPVLTDGTAAGTWTDASGHGNDATGAGAARPTKQTVDGKPALQFSGAQKLTTPAFLTTGYDTAITIFGVSSVTNDDLRVIASAGGVSCFISTNGGVFSNYMNALTPAGLDATYTKSTKVWCVTYNGTARSIWVNGVKTTQSASGNTGLNGFAFTLGDLAAGGFPMSGYIRAFGVMNAVVNDADAIAIQRQLLIETGYSFKNVVCDGNSLTAGTGSTGGNTYPAQLATLINAGDIVVNLGVSGQTTTMMLSDAAAQLAANYNAVASTNICVPWEGTNDLAVSFMPPRRSIDLLAQYATIAIGVGYDRIIVPTILPRDVAGTFEVDRQTWNTLLRREQRYAHVLCDVASDGRIGDAGDNLDTTYYSDGTHMNNTGYGIIAVAVYAGLTAPVIPIHITKAGSGITMPNQTAINVGYGINF